MRARIIIALWKHLAGGQRLRLRAVSVLVIALGSAALLVGSGIDSTARAQTTVDYDVDGDGLIEVATIAQLNAVRWDLDGDGGVDPSGDATGYATAFPNPMASMGCAATGCVGYELNANLNLHSTGDVVTGWEPIGGESSAFIATFDGGAPDFTISQLFINSSLEGIGLFGETGPGSVIRNVTLAEVNVGGGASTGALVGRNSGLIIDSSATGAVSGAKSTGGLVGESVNLGVIVGSTAGVRVTDTGADEGTYIGGLVGLNAGPIIDSHATGNVLGDEGVGGLVGSNSGAGGINRISGSTASGTVTGITNLVGGLVGENNGPIINSRATGTVRGVRWVGGLVGENSGAGVGKISGSTAAGNVTGTGTQVGGLAGSNNAPISGSHATGDVSGVKWVGGLVGQNNGAGGVNRISGSTAAGDVTGTGNLVGGLVGWNNGPISSSHATGDVRGVQWVGGLVGSSYDADAWNGLAVGMNAIGGSTASGEVTATGNLVGGLAGWNNGPISDSHARGARVRGLANVGGLVGSNYNEPGDGVNTISRSTASVAVEGTSYLGGLVGYNNGPISDSDASGSVEGRNQSGGLVGWNSGSITDSSASGDVGDAGSAGSSVGGLVGLNKAGSVIRSSATGDVTSTNSAVGGLVGRNEGTITVSAASGAVTGRRQVGGLVGYDRGVSSGDSISASRASGNVTGSGDNVGGLVGESEGTIRTSYATGAVTGARSVGGLVGGLPGAIITSYASGDVSGSGDAAGGLVGTGNRASGPRTAGSVLASYATGSVSGGATNSGGLIGVAQAPSGTRPGPSFTDSYWDTERSGQSVGVGSDDEDADGSIGGSETATSGVTGQTTSALQTPTGYTGIYADWNIAAGDPWDFGGGTDDPELRAPPNALPAFSSAAVSLTVAENAAVGSNVGAAVTATDSDSDTLTYKLVGAGVVAFDIVSGTGQLQVGAALDHETAGSYTVTVQASDGKSVAFKGVTVTVTGVNELPALSGDAAPSVADDGAGFVATYTVTDPEGDRVGAVTWSLAGTDSSYFTIMDGRLRFSATPDYEVSGHGADYAVTVQAAVAGQQGSPFTLAVTATVVNVDEAGVVSLSTEQPEVGVALTATLSDPDGGVSGATWKWARATSKNGAWIDISGETSAVYTPASGDAGHYLRATASYDDAEGTGKSARGISDNPLSGGAGVTVTPTSLTIGEGGSGTYTVVLDAQPSGDATVTIVDPTDNTDVTAEPASLTFTTTNWNTAQTVTVSAGQDDDTSDDTATVTHTVSGYGTVSTAPAVSVTVTDNDTRGVTVTPTSLTVNEGGSGTYTVVLDTQPTGDVTIGVADDSPEVDVLPSSLTFSTSNWATAQTVTVSAASDGDTAPDTATVSHTVDGGDYDGLNASSVAVTVTDTSVRGITFPVESLTVVEGSTNTYTVVLDTIPTATVTVGIASSPSADVTTSPSTLTFMTDTWNTAQKVTVTAVDDEIDEDAKTVSLTHTASGGDYGSVIAIFNVQVNDNNTRGVTVSAVSLMVNEGGSGTYTVKLNTQPTSDVTVTVNDPTNNTDVTADPASLTFSTSNWATAQTVTVSAAEDADLSRDIATVTHTVAGGDYEAFAAPDVAVVVTDNDTPGVTVSPTSMTVGEGSTRRYTVTLNTLPAVDVTVTIVDPTDNTDVTAEPASLTFTTTDWATAQTVTVRAAEDGDASDDTATVTHTVSGYETVSTAPEVSVTVTDNDTRRVTVTPTELTISEGGSGTYSVVLDAEPSGGVTVAISSNNTDVTVSPASLTFTTTNWNSAREVTVSVAQDDDQTGETVLVTHMASGADYTSVATVALEMTVVDDDSPDTVSICGRTPEVRDWILSKVGISDCAAITNTDLGGIKGAIGIKGYSSSNLLASDFEGLTGEFSSILVRNSPALKAVPANAFAWVANKPAVTLISLENASIETVEDGAFDGFTGLADLSLARNAIKTLDPGVFSGLTGLTNLSLFSNDIAYLPENVFSGLTSLQVLAITENRLTALPAGVFSSLTSLQQLSLANNRLTALQASDLTGLTSLQSLSLERNRLTTLPAGLFTGLSNVHALTLHHNDLTTLPSGAFTGLTSLVSLHLQGNSLTALESTLFAPVKNTLTLLRLDDNGLMALPTNVFSGLTNVTILYVGGNAFTTLPASVFGDMTSLEALYLREGALTTLPSGAFTGLTSLDRLYLNGNALTTLPTGAFTGLTSLTELYLYGNAFETLPSGAFTGLTSLTRLYLNDNGLETLPSGAFTGLTSLTLLYLYDNALATLPSDVFTGLTKLTLLNLRGNKFVAFPTDLFDPLSSLRSIDLGENQLTTLPANIFDDLTSLTRLHLHDNALTTLSSGAFTGLTKLSQLTLNGNMIATLPPDAFTGLTGLQRLDLSDNSLTALPLPLFSPTANLSRLYLRDNGLTALSEGIFTGLTSLQDLDLSCNALTEFDLTDPTPFDPFAGTLRHLDVGANTFTVVPGEPVVRAKLTALETLYLTGASPCLPPGNTDLSALTVSEGTLNPPFEEPGMTSAYEVTVAHDVAKITITPKLKDANAVISRVVLNPTLEPTDKDFTDGLDVALLYGWTDIILYVKSKDRRTESSHRLRVTREHPPATDARLRGLTLSDVTLMPEFGSDVFAYTADAGAAVAATTVTPVPSDPDATAVIKLNGVTDPDGTVDLAVGANTVTVEVTAEDGVMTQTYTVVVTRASPVVVTPTELTVGEGGSGTYTVVLNTLPAVDVTVTIVDPTDNTDVTAEPATLTFTTTNWNTAQTVTVSAVQDTDATDDTATVTHTVSGYGSVVTAASVTVTVAEDPTVPYDTDGNGAIDQDEASVALQDYLFNGTATQAVASAVLSRYLFGT